MTRQTAHVFCKGGTFFMFCEVTETLYLRDEEIVRNIFKINSGYNKREHQAHP